MSRKTERIGRSGEYLACSIIARETDTVTILPHGANADVVFEWNSQMYRCQVKTATKIQKGKKSWIFDLRKGSHSLSRIYKDNMIDVYAMVSLQYQNVYFCSYKDCNKKQISIDDETMKNTNSCESLHNAMNSLISATNMRQPKNVVHFAKAKIALSG